MQPGFNSQFAVSPGSIVRYNFAEFTPNPNSEDMEEIRVVQWNIERAYKLDNIINLLLELDADIIVVQEVDVLCQRSGFRDSAKELCETLRMNGVFVVEFLEIKSSRRHKSAQGGGWHGNGILSKYPLYDVKTILHSHSPINWNKDGWKFGEPRLGQRIAISASIFYQGLPICIYSIHLEIFCGIFGRLRQFVDILRDVHNQIENDNIDHFIVFGDLNTMAHGLARVFRRYCGDELRWKSIGKSESQFWSHNLFEVFHYPNNRLSKYCPRYLNECDIKFLWNPLLFDAHPQITTLQSYRGIAYKGKLDWTLMRGFMVIHSGTANDKYAFSDHKLLWVDIVPLKGDSAPQEAFNAHREYQLRCRRQKKIHSIFPLWIVLASVCTLLLFVIFSKMLT